MMRKERKKKAIPFAFNEGCIYDVHVFCPKGFSLYNKWTFMSTAWSINGFLCLTGISGILDVASCQ